MTARKPIDLTEEEPITTLSSASIDEGANVFVDLGAVVQKLKLIDQRDWQKFENKVSRASATIILLSTFPSIPSKRMLLNLGVDHAVFLVKNKSNAIKMLSLNQPIVFIDTDVCLVQQVRKKFPDAVTYWALPQEKLTFWKVLTDFIDLF